MFILMPWRVDVPQDRRPVMNWLIIAALIGVFVLQARDWAEYRSGRRVVVYGPEHRDRNPAFPQGQSVDPHRQRNQEIPGITGQLLLKGWSLEGLFGYMWIHAGVLHLAGNLLFLWIFGNAVCAKLGNLKYLLLYVFCGVIAGMVQLSFVPRPTLGASGAINGVVGMYLVLFYENEITCLFVWFLPPYARFFDVSSIWMILFWLFWDIVGVLRGHPGVAYFAHFGGFAMGFGVVMLMCWRGWITMERYEQSLLQAWHERRHPAKDFGFDADCARLGLSTKREVPPMPSHARMAEPEPIPLPEPGSADVRRGSVASQLETGPRLPEQTPSQFIRFVCVCGKRFKAPAKYAGRPGKCPQCGLRLRIPPASS